MDELKERDYRACVDNIKSKQKTGDIVKIVKRANLSQSVYYSALRKQCWSELTGPEYEVLGVAIDFFSERDELRKKLECYV
ncbi:MAG: hypothetical protein LBT50_09825 [Prevotellaceae bacterium]|jgi:hypothetical protein|nr:hypothetical protein [Prevotellaceae bacterium]